MIRPVLLSSEPWDGVWRRNQQLASRIPGTIFVEPPRPGLRGRRRVESGVVVLTPAKPIPHRWPGGRRLSAWLTASLVRRTAGGARVVAWTTHAWHEPVARALRRPVVYDRTDDWPAMESNAGATESVRRLDAALIELADEVVIVSERMRTPQLKSAALIPNGVDAFAFKRSRARSWAGHRFRIGFAGTLDPFRLDYGILDALAADPTVELVLAGPGQPPADATWFGPLPHHRVPDLLRSCDALVAPYRTDVDANVSADALKLYEYFATGLPVVATSTAGFDRYPDLVVAWPPSPSLVAACKLQARNARRRMAIAAAADWSLRASAMERLLIRVGQG